MLGAVHERNQFYGILRYFDSDAHLKKIINVDKVALKNDIDNSDFMLKRINQNLILQSTDKTRIFLVTKYFKGSVYNCERMPSSLQECYYFSDCYKVLEKIQMNSSECSPLINESFCSKGIDKYTLPVKYNLFSHEVHHDVDPLYPSCKPDTKFNEKNVRASIEKWWMEMSRQDRDPFWFHPFSHFSFKKFSFPK